MNLDEGVCTIHHTRIIDLILRSTNHPCIVVPQLEAQNQFKFISKNIELGSYVALGSSSCVLVKPQFTPKFTSQEEVEKKTPEREDEKLLRRRESNPELSSGNYRKM
jgi:hypothetical protein